MPGSSSMTGNAASARASRSIRSRRERAMARRGIPVTGLSPLGAYCCRAAAARALPSLVPCCVPRTGSVHIPRPPSEVTVSRLSTIDASFLHLESPRAHMNVGWSAIGALPEGVVRPTLADMRARVARRLRFVPRCRQRLAPHPLGLGEPHWVDDADFELEAHVIELGAPGEVLSLARFRELRDALLSAPLDRSRPLWQMAI